MRVDDRIPILVGHLEDQVVADDARARDQDVEPAELRDGSPDHRFDRRAVAHVARDTEAADRARDLASRRLVEIRHRHPGALGRQQPRRGGANPTPAAGD